MRKHLTYLYGSRILFALLCLLGSSPAGSQVRTTLKFDHFSPRDGLSGTTVLSMTQDWQGFLWIGTNDGLNRYDGHRFKTYRKIPGDTTGLTGNVVHAVLEDRDGYVWVGTTEGLTRFDPATETFTAFLPDSLNHNSIQTTNIYCLYEDANACLWIGARSGGGLWRFDPAKQVFRGFRHDPGDAQSIGSNEISSVGEDRQGRLWVTTFGGGLNRFDRASETFVRYQSQLDYPYQIPSDNLHGMLALNDSLFLLGAIGGGFIQFDLSGKNTRQYFGGAWGFDQLQDRQGRIWLATGGSSVFQFEDASSLSPTGWRQFRPNPLDPAGVKAPNVKEILEDREGNIWIGNWDAGLNVLKKSASPFEYLPLGTNPTDNGLLNTYVYAVLEDREGDIWMGAGSYLIRWDKSRDTLIHYSTRRGQIRTIVQGETGRLWVGYSAGFFSFDPVNEQYQDYPFIRQGDAAPQRLGVSNCFLGPDGLIWIASEFPGLISFDPQTEKFIEYSESHSKDKLPVAARIMQDRQGRIWMAGKELGLYDVRQDRYHKVDLQPSDGSDFVPTSFATVFEDRQGFIWAGPGGNGLIKIDPNSYTFVHFDKKDGLKGETIFGIQEDPRGNLWLATNRGLHKFDQRLGRFFHFDVFDGTESRQSAFIRSEHSGHLYYGNLENGLVFFHPDSISTNTVQPAVVFTELLRYISTEKGVETREIPGVSRKELVQLPYEENTFTISFAALSYDNPAANQYAYRLEGSDDQWIDLGNENKITFSKLAPGNYTLLVKASNNHGVWNEAGVSLNIVILPPWWRTPLAYAAYVCLLLATIYAFFQWRTYSLRRQRQLLRERVAEQTQELRARNEQLSMAKEEALAAESSAKAANEAKSAFLSTVSHELRTPLTSIIGFTKLNKKNLEEKILPDIKEDATTAQKSAQNVIKNLDIVESEGERLTHLINELLDLAKIEAGKVEWKMAEVHPAELIERATAAIAALFEQKPELKLIKEIPENLPTLTADRDRIIQVLINLISNAVKFTDAGAVTVGVRLSPASGGDSSGLTFWVADTGSGIPSEHLDRIFERFKQVDDNQRGKPKGTGLGLPICKEIVEHHGGRIWVESTVPLVKADEKTEPATGSKFFFTLPIKSGR